MQQKLQELLNDERFMRRMQLAFHSSIDITVNEDLTISIVDHELEIYLAFNNESDFDRIYIVNETGLTTIKQAQAQAKAASLVQSHITMNKDWRKSNEQTN